MLLVELILVKALMYLLLCLHGLYLKLDRLQLRLRWRKARILSHRNRV